MNRQAFGGVVQALRESKGWRQKNLQMALEELRQSGKYDQKIKPITTKVVGRIETGEVVNLYPYVELLAEAFKLSDALKVHFFAAAGYIYESQPPSDIPSTVRGILGQFHYPAHCINAVWDIHALSSYSIVLYKYTPETLEYLSNTGIGANLLRNLFDPLFMRKRTFGGRNEWEDEMLRNLRAFRAMSMRYMHTVRYRQIMDFCKAEFNEFEDMFNYAMSQELSPDEPFVRPWTTVHYENYHQPLRFMTFRLPEEYLGHETYVYGYLPHYDSERGFNKLRADVEARHEADPGFQRVYSFAVPRLVHLVE